MPICVCHGTLYRGMAIYECSPTQHTHKEKLVFSPVAVNQEPLSWEWRLGSRSLIHAGNFQLAQSRAGQAWVTTAAVHWCAQQPCHV